MWHTPLWTAFSWAQRSILASRFSNELWIRSQSEPNQLTDYGTFFGVTVDATIYNVTVGSFQSVIFSQRGFSLGQGGIGGQVALWNLQMSKASASGRDPKAVHLGDCFDRGCGRQGKNHRRSH